MTSARDGVIIARGQAFNIFEIALWRAARRLAV